MTTTRKPLAKALHTVTVVARVAAHTASAYERRTNPANVVRYVLEVLGYTPEQIDEAGPLFAACVKAVQA